MAIPPISALAGSPPPGTLPSPSRGGTVSVFEDLDRIAERLPPAARARFEAVADRAHELHALVQAAGDEAAEARQVAAERENEWRRLADRNLLKEDDPRAVAAKAAWNKALAKLARIRERADGHHGRWEQSSRIVDRVVNYVKSLPPEARLQDKAPVRAKRPTKGASSTEIAASLRRQIDEIRAQMHEVRSAPITANEAKQIVAGWVDGLAKPVDVFPVIEYGERPRLPSAVHPIQIAASAASASGDIPVHGLTRVEVPDTLGALVWLFKDQMLAKLNTEIDRLGDGGDIPMSERQARLDDLAARLLELERAECGLLVEGGIDMPLRPDVDPRALLQIDGPVPGAP